MASLTVPESSGSLSKLCTRWSASNFACGGQLATLDTEASPLSYLTNPAPTELKVLKY